MYRKEVKKSKKFRYKPYYCCQFINNTSYAFEYSQSVLFNTSESLFLSLSVSTPLTPYPWRFSSCPNSLFFIYHATIILQIKDCSMFFQIELFQLSLYAFSIKCLTIVHFSFQPMLSLFYIYRQTIPQSCENFINFSIKSQI